MGYYWPEGMLLETEENRYYLQNEETLQSAMRIGQILEGRALLCDYDHNLVVDMGCCRGIIPREEGALGIKEQTVRDIAIISRVNKSVCFLITAIEHDEKADDESICNGDLSDPASVRHKSATRSGRKHYLS